MAGVLDELEALKLAPVSHKASRLRPGYHKRMRDADPEQPVSNARTQQEIVQAKTAARFVQVRVITAFADLALLVAGFALHSLRSFTVSTRSSEIAVHIALGAQRRDVLRIVVQQSTMLAAAGVIPWNDSRMRGGPSHASSTRWHPTR